jgi:hypothetical protein
MFIGLTAVARAMQAGADFIEVSIKTGEMAVAANVVLGERVAMIVEATCSPRTADYTEFTHMLPEKVTAMQQAGVALLDEWWSLQGDIGDYMTYVTQVIIGDWRPSPWRVAELAERTSLHYTRIAAAAIDVTSAMLIPFHECATSNALRLSHQRTPKRDPDVEQAECGRKNAPVQQY